MNLFNNTSNLVREKLDERARLLSSAKSSKPNNEIIHASASEIVQSIAHGKWTATDVVESYISQAARAQSETNCVTEVMFEQARSMAKNLDEKVEDTQTLQGPLHGVPFSVKDQYNIANLDSTIGFTQWANKPATKDAELVSVLINAGAIPIVKTNVPQTMFAFECNNPLWGRTTNPYNREYTCGGSSGGEGAILSMNGSAFGIGSDIGGSLRIPTMFCGIYSLKPGKGRIPMSGAIGPAPGFEGIPTVCGPMGRSVDDIEYLCRIMFGEQDNIDYSVAPVPFREVNLPRKLKFGYYLSNGFCKASPVVKRAIQETVDALRKEGHECVEFSPPSGVEAQTIFLGLTSADSYKTLTSNIGPDSMDSTLYAPVFASRTPYLIRLFISFILRLFGETAFSSFTLATGKKSMREYMQWVVKRDDFIKTFYEQVWKKHSFDGIIAPVLPMPALKHGMSAYVNAIVAEACYYNVLDSPSGIVPVTRVDPVRDMLTPEWNKASLNQVETMLYKGKTPMYDAVSMKGLPVGVQIVGKRWEEEKVVKMMRVVDNALGKERGFGPRAWEGARTT